MTGNERLLIVSDSPDYYSARDLKKLYPGRVDEFDCTQAPITREKLAPYPCVVTLTRRVETKDRLDYAVIREHARQGARVVSHLFEYAHGSGLAFRFCNAGSERHKLKIVAASDPCTRGFTVGDSVYWYRNSNDIDEPPVGHYTYREVVCDSDDAAGRKVLARSAKTGGAMWIEERFPSGGVLLAYDLFSPLGLCLTAGDPWILDRGCLNKYVPLGNLFGSTVRHGRYLDRKLTVEELQQQIRAFAHRPCAASEIEVREEGASSEGTPVLSVRMGNPSGPRFLLNAVKHGMEWENAYGMLITLEEIARGDVIDLERFCVVAVPLLNPFGYRHGCRQNAHGVDLNRQLRRDWETFRGWTDEVIEPWTFDFKGTARGQEPEAQIESRLRAEPNLICQIDAHGMANGTVLGGTGPSEDVVRGLSSEIVGNLKDRYLLRNLHEPSPRQLTLDHHPAQDHRDTGDGMFSRKVSSSPYYSLYYENICQMPDVHATVMQTDFAAEINLTAMRAIARSIK